jgi:prevent-host-death family protein
MKYPNPSPASLLAVAEAKASFGSCLRQAERGESVVVTRHGKTVAAIVSMEDYERLRRLRAAGPEGGLASLAGGWKGSDDLVEAALSVRRSGPRRVATPGR